MTAHESKKILRPDSISTTAWLKQLGIVLPEAKKPVGLYRPTLAVAGGRLLVSGHGPWVDGKPIRGKLGKTRLVPINCKGDYEEVGFTIADGYEAAHQVGLGVLASIDASVGLDRVDQLVKTLGWVNAAENFERHPEVIDGFSNLMELVFGEQHGRGTRSAIGASSLPFGIAVEVECEFILKA